MPPCGTLQCQSAFTTIFSAADWHCQRQVRCFALLCKWDTKQLFTCSVTGNCLMTVREVKAWAMPSDLPPAVRALAISKGLVGS